MSAMLKTFLENCQSLYCYTHFIASKNVGYVTTLVTLTPLRVDDGCLVVVAVELVVVIVVAKRESGADGDVASIIAAAPCAVARDNITL